MSSNKLEQCKYCGMGCPENIKTEKLNKGRIPYDKCLDYFPKNVPEKEVIEKLQDLNITLTKMSDHKENGIDKVYGWDEITAVCEAIKALEEVEQYREMEERLKKVYGDCPDLLETVITHLERHESIDIPEPIFKARLLTDGEVDKWETYKAAGTPEECKKAVEWFRSIKDTSGNEVKAVRWLKDIVENNLIVTGEAEDVAKVLLQCMAELNELRNKVKSEE